MVNSVVILPFIEAEVDVTDVGFRSLGLTTAGLLTEVTLNTATWVALPITPLVDRNAISIQNNSGSQIKINYNQPGGYTGTIIANGSERFYNITDNIVIYAKAQAGTPTITVEEIS